MVYTYTVANLGDVEGMAFDGAIGSGLVRLGDAEIDGLMLGDAGVSKVYLGSTLLWQSLVAPVWDAPVGGCDRI